MDGINGYKLNKSLFGKRWDARGFCVRGSNLFVARACVPFHELTKTYHRIYDHDKIQALEVVLNPDREPEHVVDLRLLTKVEAAEKNGKKCVSLFFSAKLKNSGESVRFDYQLRSCSVLCSPSPLIAVPSSAGISLGIRRCCGSCWRS